MKKIALLLAVAMLFGLFVLAGCATTPAESSQEPAPASSEEPAPASSEEEPVVESSEEEPVVESSEEEPVVESSEEEPVVESSEEEPIVESSEEPAPGNKLKVPKKLDTFFVVGYDVAELEGAGLVYTIADLTGGWSHHIAFAPVDDNPGFYEVVAVSSGAAGQGAALSVPAGGFVYAINAGNNWPALMADKKGDGASGAWYDDETHLHMPNMNTDYAAAAFEFAGAVSVGEIYYIEGLDFETQEIPTSTPDKDYWDPDYEVTSKYGLVK